MTSSPKLPSSPSSRLKFRKTRVASLVLDTFARRFSTQSLMRAQSETGSFGSSGNILLTEEDKEDGISDNIPHKGFARNEQWASVQNSIMSIFQRETVSMTSVLSELRHLAQTELGPFIYDYYKNQLLPRGMRILRQEVQSHEGGHLAGLESIWTVFYTDVLSNINVVLHHIPLKEHNIRQLTILGFRDFVLLKTGIEHIFSSEYLDISPAIQQMLLVLQSTRIYDPPSENYIRLERLVGRAVNPYLGYLGLYEGNSEPVLPSKNYSAIIRKSKTANDISKLPVIYPKRRPRLSTLSSIGTLEPVTEMSKHNLLQIPIHLPVAASPPVTVKRNPTRDNKGRRYSCDILIH